MSKSSVSSKSQRIKSSTNATPSDYSNSTVHLPAVSANKERSPGPSVDILNQRNGQLKPRSKFTASPEQPQRSTNNFRTANVGNLQSTNETNDSPSLPDLSNFNLNATTRDDVRPEKATSQYRSVGRTISFELHDRQTSGSVASLEIGLENLGNTCFMNSSLQCLLHIQPLVNYFLEQYADSALNSNSPTKGMLASSFANLTREMKNTRESSLAPSSFQRTVGRFAPHLLDYQQQDSQEFLRFLLDGMSEDLCRPCSLPTGGIASPRNSTVKITENSKSIQAPCSSSSASSLSSSSNPMTYAASFGASLSSAASSAAAAIMSASGNASSSSSKAKISAADKLRSRVNGSINESSAPSKPNQMDDDDDEYDPVMEISDDDETVEVPKDSSQMQALRSQAVTPVEEDDLVVGTTASNSPVQPVGTSSQGSALQHKDYYQPRQPPDGAPSVLRSGRMAKLKPSDIAGSVGSVGSVGSGVAAVRALNSGPPVGNATVKGGGSVISVGVATAAAAAGGGEAGDRREEETACVVSPAVAVHLAAARGWQSYLKFNNSVITDIFAGQLQSTIECLTCRTKSWCFDPFLDLSVPLPRSEVKSASPFRRAASDSATKCTLQECLESFTGDEILDGEEMVTCDACKVKRKCSKRMSVYRFPRVLVIHIKRFRYNNIHREKLSTDVNFPLAALDLSPYLSVDRPACTGSSHLHAGPPIYDLVGVSNHSGTMNGGHYVAHVNTGGSGAVNAQARWVCFNDSRVSAVPVSTICGPSAYVLFYQLRGDGSEPDGKITLG